MDINQKKELAFLYIHGELEANEKHHVFKLLEDTAFRQCLKDELELKNGLKILQKKLDPATKERLFGEIKQRIELKSFLSNQLLQAGFIGVSGP